VDLPRYVGVTRKRPYWFRDILQHEGRHATPSGTFGERKQPQTLSSYMELMRHINDFEPSN
jgi:hypothetical protein